MDNTYPFGDWSYSTDHAHLADLVAHWRDSYDWRVHERTINALPLHGAGGAGPLHREPGAGPAPLPIVLSHGWPWTFWDLRQVIGPLSEPAAHGWGST